MPSIFDWSSTASSNTALDSINVNTGMSPANVDNVFRSMAAIIRSSFASALQNFLAGTAGLPVANGGTGATDAATALTNLNALSTAYRDLPHTDKSANFTFANTDRGGILTVGGAITATINPQSTTAINDGAVFVLHNWGGNVVTISAGSGVILKLNGSTTPSSTVSIALGGNATLIHVAGDVWLISGQGLS